MKNVKRGMAAVATVSVILGGSAVAHAEVVDEVKASHVYVDAEFRFAGVDPMIASRQGMNGVDLGPSPGYRLDPSILPGEGELVVVHYKNAVETISAPTATCTRSATASTPTKSGGRARGKVAMSRSTGCTGTWQGNGVMEFKNLVGLWQSSGASSTSNIGPGGSVTKSWSRICKGTRTTTWVTVAAMWYQALETSSSSSSIKLACTT